MSRYQQVQAVIERQLAREDLTADDVLRLTIASRLNGCSENTLAEALGGADKAPLNFWGKR